MPSPTPTSNTPPGRGIYPEVVDGRTCRRLSRRDCAARRRNSVASAARAAYSMGIGAAVEAKPANAGRGTVGISAWAARAARAVREFCVTRLRIAAAFLVRHDSESWPRAKHFLQRGRRPAGCEVVVRAPGVAPPEVVVFVDGPVERANVSSWLMTPVEHGQQGVQCRRDLEEGVRRPSYNGRARRLGGDAGRCMDDVVELLKEVAHRGDDGGNVNGLHDFEAGIEQMLEPAAGVTPAQ
ncbi:hypothetical protein B0H12DRAFT_1079912 [Mycena haematopus]|nr:hypothetical protein B0H12DRAFT_1079912 [Mycena haematopus]